MNRRFTVVVASLALLLPLPAIAQEQAPTRATPLIELVVGYQGRTIIGDPAAYLELPAEGHGPRIGLEWNLTDNVALVFADPEFVVASGPELGTRFSYSLLGGPRIRWRGTARVMPFTYALFGVAHGELYRRDPQAYDPTAPEERKTEFQVAFGAGIDVPLTSRLAWRAIQVEGRSLLGGPAGDTRLGITSGIVIRFGARR